jgi:hypothetical protein
MYNQIIKSAEQKMTKEKIANQVNFISCWLTIKNRRNKL